LSEKEQYARKRVCLALDVPAVEDAYALVAELYPFVGSFKIGKELHLAAGNQGVNIVEEIYKRGGKVFLDLKLHDTPNTVYKASRQCTVPGVYMFNIHIASGEKACRKAVEAAREESENKSIERPLVIGVTVLTSLDQEDLESLSINGSYDDVVLKRALNAKEWGLDGIVCPANKAGYIKKELGTGDDFIYVTPGIKWNGKKGYGQKQLYTPGKAVQDCDNSILVIGSAITGSENKVEAAKEILEDMARYL